MSTIGQNSIDIDILYDFTDIPGIETHSSQTVSKLLDPKIYTANLKSDYEYYVVHERNAYFNDLVTHLCNFFVDDNPSILLDIFAVNLPNVNTDFDALPESIRRASKGIVVSVDEEGNLFSNAWNIYAIWLALQQGKDLVFLANAELFELRNALSLCDFQNATTAIAEDKNRILQEISRIMSIEEANAYIKAGILSNAQKQADTLNTLEAYMSYALVLESLGNNEEACKYYKKAMANEDSNEVYRALITVILANMKDEMNQFDDALILFKESLQLISEEKTLLQAPGNFLHALAQILRKSRNYPEEQLAEQSFSLIKKILAKPNPRTVDILEYLAVSLHNTQNKEKKMLLELLLSVINGENFLTAITMCNLATILDEEQSYKEALIMMDKAIILVEKLQEGKNSRYLAEFLYTKAGILTSINEWDSALELGRKSLDIMKQILQPMSNELSLCIQNLAFLMSRAGKTEEALAVLQDLLEKEQNYYGVDYFNTTHTLQAICTCLFDLKRYKEAETYCQKALSMRSQALEPNHIDTAKSRLALAQIYAKTGNYSESLTLHKQSILAYEKVFGPDHIETGNAIQYLAELYHTLEKDTEALPLYERQLEINRKAYGDDSILVAYCYENIAATYVSLRQVQQAIQCIQCSLNIKEKLHADDVEELKEQISELESLAKFTLKENKQTPFDLPSENAIDMSQLQIHKEKCLGQGFYGNVYFGMYGKLPVAIKTIKNLITKEEKQNFRNEVKTLMTLTYVHIAGCYGYSLDAEEPFLVMEYMSRGSLRKWLDSKQTAIDLPFVIEKLIEICLGMKYLHSIGIVHRDLKSSNILLRNNMQIAIADFGLSKPRIEPSNAPMYGTPQWAAPEYLDSRISEKRTEKGDVFSFGVVAWEMVTRQHPWAGYGPADAVMLVLEGERLETPSTCDSLLRKIMQECWETAPTKRPSFAEILEQLERHDLKKID